MLLRVCARAPPALRLNMRGDPASSGAAQEASSQLQAATAVVAHLRQERAGLEEELGALAHENER